MNVLLQTSHILGEENSIAISFSRQDSRDILVHENDSMVIKMHIHDCSVNRPGELCHRPVLGCFQRYGYEHVQGVPILELHP